MATIKSFTSLEQSRKLAEILPHESADMYIGNYVGKSGEIDGTNIRYYRRGDSFGAPEIIEAWSLAALLCVLPQSVRLVGTPKDSYWYCEGVDNNNQWYAGSASANNPVDACYELILKLHEFKML